MTSSPGLRPIFGLQLIQRNEKAQRAEEPGQFVGPRATAACFGPEFSTPFWEGGWGEGRGGKRGEGIPTLARIV